MPPFTDEAEIVVNFLDKREGADVPYGTLFTMKVALDTSVSALYIRILDDYFNKVEETGDDFLHLAPRNFKGMMMLGTDLPQNDADHRAVPLANHILSLDAVGVKDLSIITMRIYDEGDPEFASFFQKHPSQS